MKFIVYCRVYAALAVLLCAGTFAAVATAAESPLPHIVFATGDREFARAGVAAATLGELPDATELLAGTDAQRFVRETLALLAEIAPADALRDRFASVRRAMKPRDARFNRARALAAYGDLIKSVLDAMSPVHRRVFLAGELAQSIAYNARVLRESDADRYRATLANLADADAVAPGLADLRAQLGKLDAQDWLGSAKLATAAVGAILGSPDSVPFPSAPSIWTILVRSRVPAGRDAAHLALDVVWFDGHHQTFAAYPDGDDFAKNADRMSCVRNREPLDGTQHASPLAIPLDRSYDALASSFERSCDAINAQSPPYVVAAASDDRFIAATLTAAGLDPKTTMGTGVAK